MKERPIIFNGEMVRAILDGRKTQTRRVINPKRYDIANWDLPRGREDLEHGYPYLEDGHGDSHSVVTLCPYGQPGDLLWVRETWAAHEVLDCNPPRLCIGGRGLWYAADGSWDGPRGKWRPSIHMPKWAARIFLEITNVRVERLQDISLYDIQAEGIYDDRATGNAQKQAKKFAELWNSIKAKHGYGWEVNPWVWVIEFRRIEEVSA